MTRVAILAAGVGSWAFACTDRTLPLQGDAQNTAPGSDDGSGGTSNAESGAAPSGGSRASSGGSSTARGGATATGGRTSGGRGASAGLGSGGAGSSRGGASTAAGGFKATGGSNSSSGGSSSGGDTTSPGGDGGAPTGGTGGDTSPPGTGDAGATSCPAGSFLDESASPDACVSCRVCGSLGVAAECSATADTRCDHTGGILQWGTAQDDIVMGIAVDADGNVWATGTLDQATLDYRAYQSFLTEFPRDGGAPVTKIIDSGGTTMTAGMTIDGAGNIWVVGYASGDLTGDGGYGQNDAFVLMYPSDGSDPVADQFGSSENDTATAVAVDRDGNAWVVGATLGDLAAKSRGSTDAYVRRYPADGSPPSTWQFGDVSIDEVNAIALDDDGNAWIAGDTVYPDFDTGSFDLFVEKLAPDGTVLVRDRFGTPEFEQSIGIAIDHDGTAWAVGYTIGNLVHQNAGAFDAWVRRYPADGSAPITEQFGNQGEEMPYAVTVDAAGNVWVTGHAGYCSIGDDSLDAPTTVIYDQDDNPVDLVAGCSPYQPSLGYLDAFLRVYPAGGGAARTFQLGSSGGDESYAIAPAKDGGVWIGGKTTGTLGGNASAGGNDAWLWHVTP